jgi:hypothetical protein
MDVLRIIKINSKTGNKSYFGIEFKQNQIKAQSRIKALEIVKNIINGVDIKLTKVKRNFNLLADGRDLGRITQTDYFILTQKIIKEYYVTQQHIDNIFSTRNQNCNRETETIRAVAVEILPDSYQHKTPVFNTALPNAGRELCLYQKTNSSDRMVSGTGSRDSILEASSRDLQVLVTLFKYLGEQQQGLIGQIESLGEQQQGLIGQQQGLIGQIESFGEQQQVLIGQQQGLIGQIESFGEQQQVLIGQQQGLIGQIESFGNRIDEITEEADKLIEFFKIGEDNVASLPADRLRLIPPQ